MLAAKENCSLPVFATTVYDLSGKMLTGADLVSMVALFLEGLGADAIGINCGLGPEQMKSIVPVLYEYASVPIIVNPNAGLPRVSEEGTVFDIAPQEFADTMADIVKLGARIVGGCCGTTPEHIKALVEKSGGWSSACSQKSAVRSSPPIRTQWNLPNAPLSSASASTRPARARLKQPSGENDISYVLSGSALHSRKRRRYIDVNVGLPELDEPAVIEKLIKRTAERFRPALQIDTPALKRWSAPCAFAFTTANP